MPGFGRELDLLRRTASASRSLPSEARSSDTLPPGRVEVTAYGRHYLIERSYPDPHFHGKVRIGRFSQADFQSLLSAAGNNSTAPGRARVVFLDTETTGVQGGAGICPFLIGIGYYSEDRFDLRQYFIRDFEEEASMLAALGGFLQRFDLIVTYNGQAFDLPVVENRRILGRLAPLFDHMRHLDLLHVSRRLWKVSHGSCKLTALEARIVRFLRGPDIHGSKIPFAYFDYLATGQTRTLESVFCHNAWDILSLAGLTLLAADRVSDPPSPLDDAGDLYSLGRIFDRGSKRSRSKRYYELALDAGSLPDALRVRGLERLSMLYRREGRWRLSFECCRKLIEERSFSLAGYEGAAMFLEREARDIDEACRLLDEGIGRIDGVGGMEARLRRLEARKARLQAKRGRLVVSRTIALRG